METITNIFANTYLMINVKEGEVICGTCTCRLRHNRCSAGSMAKRYFGRRSKTAFVNYRGEVLQHLFKFASTESVVSDSICDVRTVSFRNLNCLKPITYIITWMLGKILTQVRRFRVVSTLSVK